jgi:cell division protein FtsQ
MPLGSAVREVHVSPRGAWDVVLESGLRLVLGHEDIVPRARRFAAAWPQLGARGVDTKYADLRYPNGFALRQAALAAAVTPGKNNKRRSRPALATNATCSWPSTSARPRS